MITELFTRLLNVYSRIPGQKVALDDLDFQLSVNDIPNAIKPIVGDQYHVFGSCGKGIKSIIPWIAITIPDITKTATHGIYLVYLVKKDLSGYYLYDCKESPTFAY